LETLGHPEISYNWDQGQLRPRVNTPQEAVNNLRTNPVLVHNVKELQKLQEGLPGVVADVYRAKRGGNDPARNSCGRDAPSYGCTANAGTLCGSGRMVY